MAIQRLLVPQVRAAGREPFSPPPEKIQVEFRRRPNLQSSPSLQRGPNRWAPAMDNLVCASCHTANWVKTSARRTILLRYCQCRGPEHSQPQLETDLTDGQPSAFRA